jgi:ribosomal protein S27E
LEEKKYSNLNERINKSDVQMADFIAYFRVKCRSCGHHRIMHDHAGKCEGVMNKPCTSGCDKFLPEI